MLRAVMIVVAMALLGGGLFAGDMPADVAAEVAKFKDPVPRVRQQAVVAVGKHGAKAKGALPDILALLHEKEVVWVITKALVAIKEIGPDETVIKPVLPYLAKHEDFRTCAVDVFVTLGDKGVPALIEALKDGDMAEGACDALLQLGPKAKAAKAALTEVSTKHKAKPVRDKAVKALKVIAGK